jgi:hypothetical protein
MPRSMVGLLTAAGAAMSALVAFVHGDLTWVTIADAAAATGLAAYLAAPPLKKNASRYIESIYKLARNLRDRVDAAVSW